MSTREIVVPENEKLTFHLQEVLAGRRRFENAAQAFWRMVSEKGIDVAADLAYSQIDLERVGRESEKIGFNGMQVRRDIAHQARRKKVA